MDNFIYWSPYGFFLEVFSTSTFIVSSYPKVFCFSSIKIITLLLSSSTLFAYEFTSASSFDSSAYFYSASCKKSGFFSLPESYCSIVVPVKLAYMLSITFYFEKLSVSKGFNLASPTQCAFL